MELDICILILFISITTVLGGELTFELPDNEKQCFNEDIEPNVKCTLEFQVITGGNYDVDMELKSPSGHILYKDVKKQYDTFTWTTDQKGTYEFCFSNEFSTFSHKVVYFDFQVGSDDDFPGGSKGGAREPGAMTSMENSAWKVHEALKVVIDYQTHFRLRETQGRGFAEDVNERVMWWSLGQTLVIITVGVCQVCILRSFFSDKKNRIRT